MSAQTPKSTESIALYVSAKGRKLSEKLVDVVVSYAQTLTLILTLSSILQLTKKISKYKQNEATFVQFVEEVKIRMQVAMCSVFDIATTFKVLFTERLVAPY